MLVSTLILPQVVWAASPQIPPEPVLPIRPYLPAFTLPANNQKPKVDALQQHAQVWVLALSNTYQQSSQADVVVSKLQKSGFPAYVQQVEPIHFLTSLNGPLLSPVYQVLIGPDVDKSRLQEMQARLKAQYQLISRLQVFHLLSETA